MKPVLRILMPTFAGLALIAAASADDVAAFKKWYTAGMPKVIKAMETKDHAFFSSVSAPNFTYTQGGKTQKRAEALDGLKMMFSETKSIKYSCKVTSFKAVKGGIAVVVKGHYDMVTKAGPDGKTHRMVMDDTTRETWQKSGKSWTLVNITEVGKSKATMDGKPFDPSQMGG